MKQTNNLPIPDAYLGQECPYEPRMYVTSSRELMRLAWPSKMYNSESVLSEYVALCTELSKGKNTLRTAVHAKKILEMVKRSELPSDKPELYETIRKTVKRTMHLVKEKGLKNIQPPLLPSETNLILQYFTFMSKKTQIPISLAMIGFHGSEIAIQYGAKALEQVISTGIQTIQTYLSETQGIFAISGLTPNKEQTKDLAVVAYNIAPEVIQDRIQAAIEDLSTTKLFSTISGEKTYHDINAVIITHEPAMQTLDNVLRLIAREVNDVSKKQNTGITTRRIAA